MLSVGRRGVCAVRYLGVTDCISLSDLRKSMATTGSFEGSRNRRQGYIRRNPSPRIPETVDLWIPEYFASITRHEEFSSALR